MYSSPTQAGTEPSARRNGPPPPASTAQVVWDGPCSTIRDRSRMPPAWGKSPWSSGCGPIMGLRSPAARGAPSACSRRPLAGPELEEVEPLVGMAQALLLEERHVARQQLARALLALDPRHAGGVADGAQHGLVAAGAVAHAEREQDRALQHASQQERT